MRYSFGYELRAQGFCSRKFKEISKALVEDSSKCIFWGFAWKSEILKTICKICSHRFGCKVEIEGFSKIYALVPFNCGRSFIEYWCGLMCDGLSVGGWKTMIACTRSILWRGKKFTHLGHAGIFGVPTAARCVKGGLTAWGIPSGGVSNLVDQVSAPIGAINRVVPPYSMSTCSHGAPNPFWESTLSRTLKWHSRSKFTMTARCAIVRVFRCAR